MVVLGERAGKCVRRGAYVYVCVYSSMRAIAATAALVSSVSYASTQENFVDRSSGDESEGHLP